MNRFFQSLPLAPLALAFVFSASVHAAPSRIGLSDLFKNTVEGSDLVRTRAAQKTQAEEMKSETTGSLLPNISGAATYLKSDVPGQITTTGGTAGGTTTGTSSPGYSDTQKTVKLVGKQYLFQGGREYAYLSKTSRQVEASEASLTAGRQQYFLDLSTAYYDALLKQAEVEHATTELKLYDDQIAELRSRVKIGRSRSSDLLTAQASRAGSAGKLRSAESAFTTSKLTLANLARISPDFDLREESPNVSPMVSLDEYIRLGGQRPDLIAARKTRDAATEEVAYQRDGHFPTLDLGANYYIHREGVANPSKWDATLTLAVPIFAGGTTQAATREAAAALLVTEVETGRLERTTESDIRSLYQTLQASEVEMKAYADAVDLAQKSYDQTRKDYRYGLTTNLDLLNSLTTLTEAKRNYDQSKYGHFLDRVKIEIAAGKIPATASI